MIEAVPTAAASPERYPSWEALIVVLLALGLLWAGWLDARSYLVHRERPQPDFVLVDPTGSERLLLNELYRTQDTFALLDNFGAPEMGNGQRFRQALGPASTVQLTTYHPHAYLGIEFYNFMPDRDLAIRCNDTVIEQFSHQPPGATARLYRLAMQPGRNTISVGFARYNHAGLEVVPGDLRPLAGLIFLKFDLKMD